MNTDQAIQILNNATGQLKLTREEHIKIQMALDVFKTLAEEYKKLAQRSSAPAIPAQNGGNAQSPVDDAKKNEGGSPVTETPSSEVKDPIDTAEKAMA